MRIALITPGFSADESDWCIPVLLDLVRLLARDNDVHVYTLRYPHRQGSYRVYGATVHAFGGASAAGVARLPLLARALALIAGHGRHQRFDIVHGLWADEPGFLAVAASRLLSIPAVVSVMGGELVRLPDLGYGGQLSRANRWLTRFALRHAACVTVGSTFLHRIAQAWTPGERLVTLPLGVDLARWGSDEWRVTSDTISSPITHYSSLVAEETLLAKGTRKLLHVASLVPVKDQTMLLRALARVAPLVPGAHLHIVGTGPLQHDLTCLAASLGLAERVTFHGAVPHEQLPAYYAAADLCLLTSRYESQGLVTLEAAACGRATAGTAVGCLPDLLPELVVPVGDDRALAALVIDLLRDDARRSALGARTRRMVEDRYTLAHTATALMELYRGGRN